MDSSSIIHMINHIINHIINHNIYTSIPIYLSLYIYLYIYISIYIYIDNHPYCNFLGLELPSPASLHAWRFFSSSADRSNFAFSSCERSRKSNKPGNRWGIERENTHRKMVDLTNNNEILMGSKADL